MKINAIKKQFKSVMSDGKNESVKRDGKNESEKEGTHKRKEIFLLIMIQVLNQLQL